MHETLDSSESSTRGDERVALADSVEPDVFFEAVLGSLGEAVFVVDGESRTITMANAAAGRLFGRRPADFVGSRTRILYATDEDHELLGRRSEEVLKERRPFRSEFRFQRSDGRLFQAEVTITAIDADDWSKGVVSVLRDVTSLRDAEATADTLLGTLQKRVRELLCLHRVATILADQDQSLEQALHRAAEQIPPAMLHPDAASASISYGETRVAVDENGEGGPRLEARFRGASDREGTLAVRYTPDRSDPLEDEEEAGADRPPASDREAPFLPEEEILVDSIASLLGAHCRTREHRARTEKERDRFMELFRTGPMPMSLSDAETSTFVDVNDRWCDVTGYAREELLGKGSLSMDLWEDPGQRDVLRAELQKHGFVSGFKVRFRRRDGEIREAFGSVQMIELEDRSLIFSTLQDITEQVRIEEERARMEERRNALERLGSIGELAGGVAHDLNNLLLPILVNVELSLPQVSDELGARLGEIREAALRGRDLTRKLLTVARKQTLQKERVDLRDVIRSAEPLVRRMVSDSVDVEVTVPREPVAVHGDPALIEQVLVNLVANARDAVGSRGRVRVAVQTRDVDGAGHYGVTDAVGRFAYLTVEDDGSGVPPELKDKIFEPFFTTKEEPDSTGLGLSSVLGVVEQHDGHIEVASVEGGGTRFSIGLRLEPDPADDDDGTGDRPTLDPGLGAGRTALIVEDDAAVRRVTARVLRSYGFAVREVHDGPSALEAMRSLGETVDVIISDMVMPGMTGVELAAELESSGSDVPILFVSGYPWSALSDHGIEPGAVKVLQKPFAPARLLEAVSELISGDRMPR